jgi:hypothetical protein
MHELVGALYQRAVAEWRRQRCQIKRARGLQTYQKVVPGGEWWSNTPLVTAPNGEGRAESPGAPATVQRQGGLADPGLTTD